MDEYTEGEVGREAAVRGCKTELRAWTACTAHFAKGTAEQKKAQCRFLRERPAACVRRVLRRNTGLTGNAIAGIVRTVVPP